MTDTMSPGTHAPTTGLDLSTLGLMLEALDDFIGASLSPELQLLPSASPTISSDVCHGVVHGNSG